MKRYIILFVLIVTIGGLAIFLPGFLSSRSERKEAEAEIQRMKYESERIKEISSTTDDASSSQINEEDKENELYDEHQMYFEGIEALYDYLTFGQVEDIKQRVQVYVHEYIDDNLLDCIVLKDSIQEKNGVFSFNLEIKNVDEFILEIIRDENNIMTDITIIHSDSEE